MSEFEYKEPDGSPMERQRRLLQNLTYFLYKKERWR